MESRLGRRISCADPSAPDGILAGLAAPKIWVDVSTVSPGYERRDIAALFRVLERLAGNSA
ncbi:MAG TPA: hypothetical protein VMT59_13480 [Gaiellaceae bacterium]|nr:hypothetical protein [Gaiellaceae bacterium]